MCNTLHQVIRGSSNQNIHSNCHCKDMTTYLRDWWNASYSVSGKLKYLNKTLHRSWNWTVRWMHCIWLTFIWPWTDLDIRSHKIQHSVVLKHMQAPDVLKVLMKFEKGDSYEKILMFMILQYHVLALSISLMFTKTINWKSQWFDITVQTVQKGHPLRGLQVLIAHKEE